MSAKFEVSDLGQQKDEDMPEGAGELLSANGVHPDVAIARDESSFMCPDISHES